MHGSAYKKGNKQPIRFSTLYFTGRFTVTEPDV